MRTPRGLPAAVLALAAVTGCAATPTGPTTGAEQVEVFGWWASGAEKRAMDVLVSAFRADHPEVTFLDATVAGGAGTLAQDVLASRLANDDPPDVFQVHGGAELAAHVAAGDVAPVDQPLGPLDPVVASAVTVDQVAYAVPVDLHRANLLWANTTVLSAAGLEPTARYQTLDQWFVALEAVRAAGYLPLALGSTWTQVHLLETVLLARLGPAGYQGLWDGSTDARSPAVATAVGDFARLLGFTNADRTALDWQDAVAAVAEGEAAFAVMGDWAQPVLGPPVVWAPFPGTDGVVDLVVDAFALATGAEHPGGADAWFATIADVQAQVAFANAKGAIPARADAAGSALGTYQRSALAEFRGGTVVGSLTHGMVVAPGALAEISRVTEALAAGTASAAQLQAALAAAPPP